MFERRVETRLLCADMVDVFWKDKTGRLKKGVANLEDISLSGACLQLDAPIPLQTMLSIKHAKGQLEGKVRYCVFRDIGYFIGVEFASDSRWSLRQFKPQHLLDPRRLVMRTVHRLRATAPPSSSIN